MSLSSLKSRGWVVKTAAVLFCAAVPLLKYLQVPCRARPEMIVRATVLGSAVFLLTLPAAWFVCRRLFGRLVGTALLITYLLLALFPFRIFYPKGADLCGLVSAPPKAFFGTGGVFILAAFALLGLLGAYLLHRRTVADYLRRIPLVKVLIYCSLLLLAFLQVLLRYGSNSPKSVDGGWHHDSTPYNRSVFWGVRYGGGDHPMHIEPSGMFRGVGSTRTYNAHYMKINNRSMGPFLYSLVCPFLNPYASAVAVNFVFYFIILIASYLLATRLGLNQWISVGFSILLSANHYILWRTVEPYFYIQYDAALILLFYGMIELGPLDGKASASTYLIFGSLLSTAALCYDSVLVSTALILWTVFRVCRFDGGFDWRVLAAGIGFALLPHLIYQSWDATLKALHVAGSQLHTSYRVVFMKKLLGLPGYIFDEPWQCLRMVDNAIARLLLLNRLDTQIVEYWASLGLLGVISLFALLPRYCSKEPMRDLMLLFFSCVVMGVLTVLAGALPPRTLIDQLVFDPERTTAAAYPAVVLGQSVGLFHLAGKIAGLGRIRARNILFAAFIAVLFVLSFGRQYLSGS